MENQFQILQWQSMLNKASSPTFVGFFVCRMMGRFGDEETHNINIPSFNNAAYLWAKPY